MASLSAQYPPVEPPMIPQDSAPGATRYAVVMSRRTSSAKYFWTCGPPGTSTHSVSRGSTTLGRIITRTAGGTWWRLMAVASRPGRSSLVIRLRGSPG